MSNIVKKVKRGKPMKSIKAREKKLKKLLSETVLGVDYYQREYKWGSEQVNELIRDLHDEFKNTYNTSNPDIPYKDQTLYFLGSIVVIKSKNTRYIVDGQQRITTIFLILIYLKNFLKTIPNKFEFRIQKLIYDESQNSKKYWLDVADRIQCMKALLSDEEYSIEGKSESVKNMVSCYENIKEVFLSLNMDKVEIRKFSLWIVNNVKVVEIKVTDDQDAYTIFETMNDRGLDLSATDMLRGYLLSNVEGETNRIDADKKIGMYLEQFKKHGGKVDADFFKTWLRSQYASKIRTSKKDTKPEYFDNIGEDNYNRWVRDNKDQVIADAGSFYNFVHRDLSFFAEVYLTLLNASIHIDSDMRSVKFNSDIEFTLQHQLIMAGISPNDNIEVITKKIRIISDFIDIWLNLRIWNHQSNRYDNLRYPTFNYMQKIRRKSVTEIQHTLREILDDIMTEHDFSSPRKILKRHHQSARIQLARMIDWLEIESGVPGKYVNYRSENSRNPPYNIEHIWHDDYAEFNYNSQEEFDNHRNLIGGLLLIKSDTNRILSNKGYKEKLDTYYRENILASSLHRNFYNHNHKFLRAMKRHGINFEHHDKFTKKDIISRSRLYCEIAKLVWSPDRILEK